MKELDDERIKQNGIIRDFDELLCSKANKTALINLEKTIYEDFLRKYDYERIEIEMTQKDKKREADMAVIRTYMDEHHETLERDINRVS